MAEDLIYIPTKDELIALEPRTGELRWRHPTGEVGFFKAVEGVLYVGGRSRGLYALDARTGELLWDYWPEHTFKSSVLADGWVYLVADSGHIHALNARTGGLAWIFESGAGVEFFPSEEDSVMYFGSSYGYVYAISAQTGEPFWRFEEDSYNSVDDPVESDGVVYFGADRYGSSDRTYALNALTGEVIWRVDIEGDIRSAPVVVDNRVYIVTTDVVKALDVATGAVLWLFRRAEYDYFFSAFVAGGSDIYLGTWQGRAFALDATTGEVLWQELIDQSSMVTVTFGSGVVYASAFPSHVTALDAESGALLWKIQLPRQTSYAGEALGNVPGLSSPPVSSVSTGGPPTRPVVGHGMVFVGSDYGLVYALDAANGELDWAFESWGEVWLSPVLSDGVLYFASSDDHVYALDAVTGSPLWHYDVESWISTIRVLDGVLFVIADGERVLALTGPEG